MSGIYSCEIRDANLCLYTVNNIIILEPNQLLVNATFTDITCFGDGDGTVTANDNGGGTSPYNYSVSFSSNLISQGMVNQSNDVIIDDLESGNYSISVTDFNNCSLDTMVVLIQFVQPALVLG